MYGLHTTQPQIIKADVNSVGMAEDNVIFKIICLLNIFDFPEH